MPSTAHYRGTDIQTDGQTNTLLHTHSAGHTNRAIEIASKFHNCKVFSRKMPTSLEPFFRRHFYYRECGEWGRARRPQVCIVRTLPFSLPLSLSSSACMHTDCAYATLNAAASPAAWGCDLLLLSLLLPVLPSSLIWPLNSWLTNFAGFQLRPCAAQQEAWRGQGRQSLAIKMPKRIRAAR